MLWVAIAAAIALVLGRLLAPNRTPDIVAVEADIARRCGGADSFGQFDRMIDDLERRDPQLARIAMLRWIGGLSEDEIANVLGSGTEQVRQALDGARHVLLAPGARAAT